MYRMIRAKQTFNLNQKSISEDDIFLSTEIIVHVSLPRISVTAAESININKDKLVDVEAYREDVADILEKEFKFQVVLENVKGKLQRGKSSNRNNSFFRHRNNAGNEVQSASVYFNVFYDLINSEFRPKTDTVPHKVKCSIFIDVSEHWHNDLGDIAHRNFINEQAEKRKAAANDIDVTIKDEFVQVPEYIYNEYKKALDDVRTAIKERIQDWTRRYYKVTK